MVTVLQFYAKYLEENDLVLGYTPFYQAIPVKRDSFNYRYLEAVLHIEPTDILNRNYGRIVRQFINVKEYICGFNPDLRPVSAEKFVVEMIYPHYSFKTARRRCGTLRDDVAQLLEWNTNAAMVTDCIEYALDAFSDEESVKEIMRAPCFLRDCSAVFEEAESVADVGYDLYMENLIARYD